MRSVKTASASLGSVTTWKTWWLVRRFARYWSRPRAMGIRYTRVDLGRGPRPKAHRSNPRSEQTGACHTIHDNQTRGGGGKDEGYRQHV